MNKFHVSVELSPLFFGLLAWLLVYEQKGLAAGCLAASLIHECGHLLMMFFRHCLPRRIVVGIFGMRMERDETCALGFMDDVFIAVGGPAINLACGLLFFLLGKQQAAAIHLVLAGLNLLPVDTLDGGTILLNILYRFLPYDTAGKVMLFVSIATVFPLGVAGFYILLKTGTNISLLLVDAYLVLLLIFHAKR